MKNKALYIIGGLLALVVLTAFAADTGGVSLFVTNNILTPAGQFVASFEGFQSTPYWDVTRWSWGYGTPAPGPTGSITQAEAEAEMDKIILGDYTRLQDKITRVLSGNQWSALLSFSYNLGIGNAYNLVSDINSGDDTKLEAHWKEYIYAGGAVNQDLITRRNREWEVWSNPVL